MGRKLTTCAGTVAALAVVGVLTAAAHAGLEIPQLVAAFDEQGNSSFGGRPLDWGFGPAPDTDLRPTLFYRLLFPVMAEGYLVVVEPLTTGGQGGGGDVLRFVNNATGPGSVVYVYSDTLDGADSLADVGLPLLAPQANLAIMMETGTDGVNGVFYAPNFGQPGFARYGNASIDYAFTSDVPEPLTMLGVLAGVGGIGAYLRKRRA